ncbi:regulator of telomere elongation helicase 1 homolog isoform X1 [Convolutriloba macropyga]
MSEVHQIPNSGSSKRQKMDGIGGRAENIKSSSAPKIFYSSRTHSQLSQAIGELKRVNFPDIKAVVIGSRDQLCIHPEVKQENNATVKTHLCRQKVKTRTCHFYNNYEKLKESGKCLSSQGSSSPAEEVLDIEDLVQQGMSQSVCPYFYSREMSSTRANIVFMPYNYIIDPSTRKAHNIDLANNVIIFDEGHNIDSLCEESASFSMTSLEVAAAFKETQKLLEKLAETDKKFQGNSDKDVSLNESDVLIGDEQLTPEFNTTDIASLATIFHNLETTLLNVNVSKTSSTGSSDTFPQQAGAVFRGSLIYSWLEDAGLRPEITPAVISTLDKVASYLSTLQSNNAFNVRPYGIMKMADVLKQLYPDQGQDLYANYFLKNCSRTEFKMHVSLFEEREKAQPSDPWAKKNVGSAAAALGGGSDTKPRMVNYWCFSPAYALKSVIQHHVRSVIITSGTLSPLSSFELEMRMSFPWQLQNPHIVQPSQFFASVVHSGPLGSKLSSAYSNRSNKNYLDDLGALISNMSKVVPHGMLVFFPSYTVMSSCIEFWKSSDTWNRITLHKPVHVEPKDKASLAEVIAQYNLDVRSREDAKGAAFFAVCRGKVSEGLDFADINGRAVIITGLPYPPQFDPRVKLKMEYLDTVTSAMKDKNKVVPNAANSASVQKNAGAPTLPQLLDGRTWYQQQAIRAVNQAIGRVLRHKNDYGAILLCDERFAYSSNIAHLSSWIRPSIRHYKSFSSLPKDLISFYRIANMKYPYQSTSSSSAYITDANNSNISPPKVKKSTISGLYQLREARPGLKKSNEVTHHVAKPDWLRTESGNENLSTYLSSADDESRKMSQQGKSVLTQLLTFDDEVSTSKNDTKVNEILPNLDASKSQTMFKKKIKLVRNSRATNEVLSLDKPSSELAGSRDQQHGNHKLSNCGNQIKENKEPAPIERNGPAVHAEKSVSAQLFTILQRELVSDDFREFKKATLNYINPDNKKPNASYNYIVRFIQSKMKDSKFSEARSLMSKYIKKEHRDHYAKLCSSLK